MCFTMNFLEKSAIAKTGAEHMVSFSFRYAAFAVGFHWKLFVFNEAVNGFLITP